MSNQLFRIYDFIVVGCLAINSIQYVLLSCNGRKRPVLFNLKRHKNPDGGSVTRENTWNSLEHVRVLSGILHVVNLDFFHDSVKFIRL